MENDKLRAVEPEAGPRKKGPRWSYTLMPERGITVPCDGDESCPMFHPYSQWSRHFHEPAPKSTYVAETAASSEKVEPEAGPRRKGRK